MLLNKFQRQQRLNPDEQVDPMMRSMMDAVRQVYANQETETGGEEISTEDEASEENK
tara:strand:- start:706 stop:876 length:171 start_codon:yes stop_codon:yes gene_type:complete